MTSSPAPSPHLTPAMVLFLPGPLSLLVRQLESNCVYGCCYMDAFDLSAENAGAWLKTVKPTERRQCREQLEAVLTAIRASSLPIYVTHLGDFWKRDEATDFFEQVQSAVNNALETIAPDQPPSP